MRRERGKGLRGARGDATIQDRLNWGSVSGSRLRSRAILCYRISQIVTKWRQLLTGPSARSQLIDLFPDEANINSAQRGLELINVLDGHTCESA